MGCVNPTNKQNKNKKLIDLDIKDYSKLNINDSSKETQIQQIQDTKIHNKILGTSQIEKILLQQLDNQTTSNDNQMIDQQQQYDHLKNLLIFKMLGHKSTHYIPERQCQPNYQLYLKNSDELLWEDQRQLDEDLLSLISLRDDGDYVSGLWKVSNSQSIEITIIRSHDLGVVREFENDYFNSKRVQQSLKLLNHKTIAEESYKFHYNNNIFRIQQSQTFIKMVDFPLMTLHKTLKIRKQADNPYSEEEITHVILDLLKAVRDAETVGITHGGITDKRIFMSSSGNYKLSGFSEVRIKGLKKQQQQKKQQTSCFQSRMMSDDDDEKYGINPSLTLTYSFLKYHAHKFPPRSIIFCISELSSLFKNAMISYYDNKYQDYKMRHEQENYKYLGTEEEKHIRGLLRKQDIYSIMVVALQMMTLGDFEKDLCLQGSKKSKSGPQFPQVLASLAKSMYAFPIDDHNQEMSDAIRRKKLKKLMHFYLPTQADISVYMNKYESKYPRIYNCINYVQKDLKSLIMSIENSFDPDRPNDKSLFENYVAPNLINDIIKADLERFNAAALKSLDRDRQFSSIREMFYRIQGYMLIRNFRQALKQIDLLTNLLDKETSHILPNHLKYYKMQNAMNLFLTDLEEVIVILMQGICQIEMRNLVNAKQTFLRLEGLIQDNQLINSQIIRFYSSLANFYSGNTQDALISFQRVQEMSNGDLLKQDQIAYFQLSQLLVLNYQDLNDYTQVFRLLKEQLNHHTIIQMKFGYVGSGHISCLFQISKAYFEVSQFKLSIKYFNQTLNKLKERENMTMLPIELQTLGHLSHLYYTFNVKDKFLLNLEASIKMIDKLLQMEQYLETIILWLNRFGFLLCNLLKSDRLTLYIDELIKVITKNEDKMNIDLFFKNYVFSKLYFFSLQQKKSQQSFLDTLEMQQCFKSDDLRTPNVGVDLKLKKKQFDLNVQKQKLDQFRKKQKTGGANLPPPEKDNLTIRILIEIYDWLGYLFKLNQEPLKAVSSYQQHQELVSNLIKYNQSQGDVYLLRKAKINFSQQKYSESILMLREISLQKNKQNIDSFLLYQYNLIQAEIQLWIGTIHYILNQDQEANNTYINAKQQILRILKSNNEFTDIMEVTEQNKFTQTNKSRGKIYNKTIEGSLHIENIYVDLKSNSKATILQKPIQKY